METVKSALYSFEINGFLWVVVDKKTKLKTINLETSLAAKYKLKYVVSNLLRFVTF
jgi:hypothetical protein